MRHLAVFSTEIKFEPERWQSTFRAGEMTGRDWGDAGVEVGDGEGGGVKGDGDGVGGSGGGEWTGAKWIKDWRGQG